MINLIDKQSLIYLNKFNLKWDRIFLYGYYGEEDGFYQWLDTKQQEQQGSNKQGSISLKDSSKVSQGTGYTALFSGQKGSDILQDKTMYLPGGRAFTIILSEDWNKASKDWNSLCSSDESEV